MKMKRQLQAISAFLLVFAIFLVIGGLYSYADTGFNDSTERNEITGATVPYAKVSVKISKKWYSAIADENGEFVIPIPQLKKKMELPYKIEYGDITETGTSKFFKNWDYVEADVARDTTKLKVSVSNVRKGDTLIVKIGRKKYKKKINKKYDVRPFKCTIKISKPKKAKKVIYIVRDKNNHITNKVIEKHIYYAERVKKGMTKKQCKNVPGWESPYKKTHSKGKTIWWYEYGSWLKFKKGKLIAWHY